MFHQERLLNWDPDSCACDREVAAFPSWMYSLSHALLAVKWYCKSIDIKKAWLSLHINKLVSQGSKQPWVMVEVGLLLFKFPCEEVSERPSSPSSAMMQSVWAQMSPAGQVRWGWVRFLPCGGILSHSCCTGWRFAWYAVGACSSFLPATPCRWPAGLCSPLAAVAGFPSALREKRKKISGI